MTALLVHNGGLTDIVCALQLGWASIEILHVCTRAEALRTLEMRQPDIVVVDTSESGFDLTREIRRKSNAVIVAVSSQYAESDLIAAVEAGCDDYMEVPVSATTFVARVRAALRRVMGATARGPDIACCGNLVLDPSGYEARVGGRPLRLTAKEFELLLDLAQRNGQVVRHESLSRLIWGDDGDLYAPWLRKYIQHLRHKLAEAPEAGVMIVTVPRVGYKLVPAETRSA